MEGLNVQVSSSIPDPQPELISAKLVDFNIYQKFWVDYKERKRIKEINTEKNQRDQYRTELKRSIQKRSKEINAEKKANKLLQ